MIVRITTLAPTLIGITLAAAPLSSHRPPAFIWNASASVPIGLYRVRPIGYVVVPDLVVAVPPEPLARFLVDRGYLPRRVPLLKRAAALPGHAVCRVRCTITVDGTPSGAVHERDGRNHPLPIW